MKKEPIWITGLMVSSEDDHIVLEIEFDGLWHEISRDFIGLLQMEINRTIEPREMMTKIEADFHFD